MSSDASASSQTGVIDDSDVFTVDDLEIQHLEESDPIIEVEPEISQAVSPVLQYSCTRVCVCVCRCQ